MGRKLNTTVQVGPYIYEAGTDEADIEGADTITADVWDGSKVDAGDPAGEGYDGFKVADLKAEIERRNEGRDDDAKLSVEGNKGDLIATLVADDEAQV